jgi:type VI protein secretion system component VasK
MIPYLAAAFAVLLLAALILLVWWLWRRRVSASEPGLGNAWNECAAACGDGRPWWLVIGPSAGGKSSLLGESGLPWNLRPGVGGQTCSVPRAWRHEGGCLVEVPGAWTDAATPHPGWSAWLGFMRRNRRCRPLAGLVACVPLSDLLRRGPTYVSAVAAALRERGTELAQAIGRSPPLYLVLTKADHIGGFKDFFAGLAEVERQQVLGTTLGWPLPELPAQAWTDEHRALVEALRARRPLGLMRARDGEAARKLFQFPNQLDGLVQPVGELVAQIVRPGRDGCVLRGVYLTSCHRPSPAAPPPTMRGERTDLERSVYLGHGRTAAPSTGGSGHFSHALIARVLPEDRHLARPTGDRRRLYRRLRIATMYVIPALAVLAALWLVAGAWRSAALLSEVQVALGEVRSIERLHPGDAPRNLDALDRLGAGLARLADHETRAARPGLEAAAGLYARRLGDLCADRAVRDLGGEIARLRAAPEPDTDRLYDAFRAYQMLAGSVPPEPEVLERELIASRYWFLGLESAGASLDWPTEVLARRQLERLGRDLLPRGLALAGIDRQLVDATARELGEALWIRQGWEDILREAHSQFPHGEAPAAVGAVLPGPMPDGVLTRRAWDDAISALVDEKSVAIEATLRKLSVRLDRDAIHRRLAERFRAEHRRAWLGLIAGAHVISAEDPAAVPARIAEAAGPISSWPALVRRALDELDPPSALASLAGTARAPWTRPALDPVLELRRDVEAFLTATADGRRAADLERVLALARRFDEASAAAANRLAEVQPDDLRDALRAGVSGIVHGLWSAIDRAALRELEEGWRSQVVPAWRRDCQGRFPFCDVADEVSLIRFAAFANPQTGVLAHGMAPIDRLRAQGVAGRPALTVSRAYLDLAMRTAAVREAFFAGGGEQVVAPCVLTLVQREGVTDIAVAVGAQQAKLYDRPDARYELTLRQGEPGGAKISIRVVTGEWKTREFAGRDWGWLRLLRAGSPRAAADGGWTLTWPFDGSAAGGTVVWRAQALLEGRYLGEAVAGDLLTAFMVPEALMEVEKR